MDRSAKFRSVFLSSFALILGAQLLAEPVDAAIRPPQRLPEYRLHISFDVPHRKILGRATIQAPRGMKLAIDRGEFKIRSLTHNGKKVASCGQPEEKVVLQVAGPVHLTYEADLKTTDDNTIDDRGILLLGNWYPSLEGFYRIRLTAVLPKGYIAVSEADRVTQTAKDGAVEFAFDFPHPIHEQRGISFLASRRFEVSRDSYNHIELCTYLFPEEAHLAPRYLERLKLALKRYEAFLGPYPFRRLAIVERFLGESEAAPTFVLMGQEEFQTPDLEETNLNHEIVHQWLGLAVSPDYDQGNWCEGLTLHFAHQFLAEKPNEDWQSRRAVLACFQNNLRPGQEFPLRRFTERFDRSSSAIGYCKGAMVVHMLRRTLGDPLFLAAIKDFIKTNSFTIASWEDLKNSFERLAHKDLSRFFSQWVDHTGQPELKVTQISQEKRGKQTAVALTLRQGSQPFRVTVPVTFYESKGRQSFPVTLTRKTERFTFLLESPPDEVVIDENYDVLRKLSPMENPPTLERLLTARNVVVVPPLAGPGRYREAIKKFTAKGARVKRRMASNLAKGPDAISKSAIHPGKHAYPDIANSSLIFPGWDRPALEPLLGKKEPGDCSAALIVRNNHSSPENVVAILNAASEEEVSALLKEAFANPLYSNYCSKDGKNISFGIADSARGIRLKIARFQH